VSRMNRVFWFNLAGSTGFKGDGASVQVGLDIDNAEFYVGLDDGSGFTQGEASPENYEITIWIDESGAEALLSVEFQGSEVVLSENVIHVAEWR
jgi:hypothetical protein